MNALAKKRNRESFSFFFYKAINQLHSLQRRIWTDILKYITTFNGSIYIYINYMWVCVYIIFAKGNLIFSYYLYDFFLKNRKEDFFFSIRQPPFIIFFLMKYFYLSYNEPPFLLLDVSRSRYLRKKLLWFIFKKMLECLYIQYMYIYLLNGLYIGIWI